MNVNGIVLEIVHLCEAIFCTVLRGSRERSSRWSAAVTDRTRAGRSCEGEAVGVGRLDFRRSRAKGAAIILGTDADGPDDVRDDIAGLDMIGE
jgi:hypothetical protein